MVVIIPMINFDFSTSNFLSPKIIFFINISYSHNNNLIFVFPHYSIFRNSTKHQKRNQNSNCEIIKKVPQLFQSRPVTTITLKGCDKAKSSCKTLIPSKAHDRKIRQSKPLLNNRTESELKREKKPQRQSWPICLLSLSKLEVQNPDQRIPTSKVFFQNAPTFHFTEVLPIQQPM